MAASIAVSVPGDAMSSILANDRSCQPILIKFTHIP